MNGGVVDLIILAMLAGFIILRLRSVLGRRPEDDQSPAPGQAGPRPQDGPVARKPGAVDRDARGDGDSVVDMEADPKLREVYRRIRRADASFDPAGFLSGAREAYTMILEAFWAGDKETIKPFLSDKLYTSFAKAMDDRAEQGHQVENKIVDLDKVDIADAEMVDGRARLTVRFVTSLVNLVRDEQGRVIEGDPTDTIEVTDRWTFERDPKSADPNWTLIATRSE
mgnify:CR=1 FL=1